MSIAFITDSTAYLTPEQMKATGVEVVPLTVRLGNTDYLEGRDISNAAYYQLLMSGKDFPKTSQPSPGEFAERFERLIQTHDTVLGLFLSAGVSGTLESARQAAAMVGGDIRVIDSRIASYGISGPLLDGVEMAKSGGSAENIVDMWNTVLDTVKAYFVVDSLDLLHRGGRIGGAAAVFGSLLQIKPILTVREGRIELFDKVRTHKRAMANIRSLLDDAVKSGQANKVGVVHANRLNDAEALAEELKSAYPQVQVDVSDLGPVVGSHVGPGTLALVFYQSVYEKRA